MVFLHLGLASMFPFPSPFLGEARFKHIFFGRLGAVSPDGSVRAESINAVGFVIARRWEGAWSRCVRLFSNATNGMHAIRTRVRRAEAPVSPANAPPFKTTWPTLRAPTARRFARFFQRKPPGRPKTPPDNARRHCPPGFCRETLDVSTPVPSRD